MAEAFLCTACGTQYPPTARPPASCAICEDERQYVPASGQAWTTLAALRRSHKLVFRYEGAFLGIGIAPSFAIGERALLVRTPQGNLLWDCLPLVDRAGIELITALGGLRAIAISHPHYYTSMVDWSQAFGGVPVHLHAADRNWVMRPDARLAFWEGARKEIWPGLTLVRCGGHFRGASVLHVASAHEGRGALLVGDLPQVVPDGRHLGFMRSYPNYIPLGGKAVHRIATALEGLAFEAIYGAFWDGVIPERGRAALDASVARHLAWLETEAEG